MFHVVRFMLQQESWQTKLVFELFTLLEIKVTMHK